MWRSIRKGTSWSTSDVNCDLALAQHLCSWLLNQQKSPTKPFCHCRRLSSLSMVLKRTTVWTLKLLKFPALERMKQWKENGGQRSVLRNFQGRITSLFSTPSIIGSGQSQSIHTTWNSIQRVSVWWGRQTRKWQTGTGGRGGRGGGRKERGASINWIFWVPQSVYMCNKQRMASTTRSLFPGCWNGMLMLSITSGHRRGTTDRSVDTRPSPFLPLLQTPLFSVNDLQVWNTR